MKVQPVSNYNLSFNGSRKKFDVQGHVGAMYDGLRNENKYYNTRNIFDTVEVNNVQKILVSSVSGLNPEGSSLYKSEIDCAHEVAAAKGNEKVKIYQLLSCQPGIIKDTETIEALIDGGRFYGLKFHPTNTDKSVKDNFDIYSKYMSVAEKKGLPCVFHSTTDGKSDPAEIIKLAEAHPKHPVVLYHIDLMSTADQMSKTIDNISNSVKAGKSNLFVDLSWLTNLFDKTEENKNIINQVLEKIGPDRILFGSDCPIGEMGNKDDYGKFADFVEDTVKGFYGDKSEDAEKALNKIFYDNAEALFIEKKWYKKPPEKNAANNAKFFSKRNILIGAGILVAGMAAYIVKYLHDDAKRGKTDLHNPSRVIKH